MTYENGDYEMDEVSLGDVLVRTDSDDYQTAVVCGLGTSTVSIVVTYEDKSQLLTTCNRKHIGPDRRWRALPRPVT